METPIYLDHNATTPVAPEVLDAMLPYLQEHFGNPSSGHPQGREARRAVEEARAQVAALIGARPDEIIFTSGGTEASNLAIFGVASHTAPERRRALTATIEHPATTRPCDRLAGQGWEVARLRVDAQGVLRLDEAREALRAPTGLVTLMHANNETGALQPIAEVAALAREAGAVVHTDAAQSVGKVEVDVAALGVDLLTIAGHKLYAPKGVGALYVRRGVTLAPFALGGGQERGLRPGTENVPYVVGLGAACALARRTMTDERQRLTALRDRLHRALREAVAGLALNGPAEARLPNTLNVRFPGVSGSALLAACPEIAASTGSACHEGGERASAVVLAMGVPEAEALGSVRLSLGRLTDDRDIFVAAEALIRAWRRLDQAR